MIDLDFVFDKACGFIVDDLSESQKESLEGFCELAKIEVFSRLKSSDYDEYELEISLAIGALAAALFFDLAASNVDSLSVGSLSLKYGGGGNYDRLSQKLRQQSEVMLSGLVYDDGFSFKAVK